MPAGIDRDAVRMDPVQGLLGLAVTGKGDLLDDDGVRAAINMAVDRNQLLQMFPLGGWAISEQLLPGQLDLPVAPPTPAWVGQAMDDRRAQGRAIIDRWRGTHGDPPPLRIALPADPGSTLLFGLLARDLGAIGLAAERVNLADKADLSLIDEVAAYDSALWYLGRIGCARKIHCSPEGEAALQAASLASTAEERAARVAQAVGLIQGHDGYIPLGAPIRWSLVSKRLSGFLPSPRGRHPLNHLFRSTN